MAKQWGMLVDTRRCVGCQGCTVACKAENSVGLGSFRTHVKIFETGTYPKTKKRFVPMLCMHCKKPPCVDVCPVEATYKRNDGLVLIDYEKCIGCGYCLDACPYDARYLNSDVVDEVGGAVEWGGKRSYGKADKCTFCAHRLAKGIEPACVNTCVGKARQFGDFNDKSSVVSKIKNDVLQGNKMLMKASDKYGPLELGGLSVLYILPANKEVFNLPSLGNGEIFDGKRMVKVVGAVAATATFAALGFSMVSSSIGGSDG